MALKGGLQIKGIEKFVKNLEKIAERAQDAARAAVYLEANNIMADAVPGTPKKTGALRSSAYVTLPDENAQVEIGFGGPAADYAMVVHEKMFENYTTDGTGPKYLEITINAYKRVYERDIAALFRAAFEQSGNVRVPRGSFPDSPWVQHEKNIARNEARRQRARRKEAGKAIREAWARRGGG